MYSRCFNLFKMLNMDYVDMSMVENLKIPPWINFNLKHDVFDFIIDYNSQFNENNIKIRIMG